MKLLTVIAVVVYQDYLFKKVGRCPVDGRVYGPQDDRQGFIHKNEHNAHLRKVQGIRNVSAPVEIENVLLRHLANKTK